MIKGRERERESELVQRRGMVICASTEHGMFTIQIKHILLMHGIKWKWLSVIFVTMETCAVLFITSSEQNGISVLRQARIHRSLLVWRFILFIRQPSWNEYIVQKTNGCNLNATNEKSPQISMP